MSRASEAVDAFSAKLLPQGATMDDALCAASERNGLVADDGQSQRASLGVPCPGLCYRCSGWPLRRAERRLRR
jgi:hypothetical protein